MFLFLYMYMCVGPMLGGGEGIRNKKNICGVSGERERPVTLYKSTWKIQFFLIFIHMLLLFLKNNFDIEESTNQAK